MSLTRLDLFLEKMKVCGGSLSVELSDEWQTHKSFQTSGGFKAGEPLRERFKGPEECVYMNMRDCFPPCKENLHTCNGTQRKLLRRDKADSLY